jgi:hypothetical protein
VKPARIAALLFAALTLVYLADGGFAVANGAKPNVWLTIAILDHHALSFARAEEPFMFTPHGEKYYLTASALPGRYAGTFGLGAGLTALPALAVVRAVAGRLEAHPWLLWYAARAIAAACVAASAAFVFLAALAFTTRPRALAVALVYALGGCAWSIASQALYQHGPDMMFLALGAYLLVRGRDLGAGLALGAATWCRPTSAVVVVCAAGWLVLQDRRRFVRFAVGAGTLVGLLALYNWHWLGAPWHTGQTVRAADIARGKTGVADPWQTPFALGLAGLLVSPSRGLFIFSPLFALSFVALIPIFRDDHYACLRPLSLAALGLVAIAAKWFDWWGGWTYGYRPLVDVTPLLALMLVPLVDAVFARRWRRTVAALLLGWSIAVQALGAFTYDTDGWNASNGRDIDRPRWRDRLWSFEDWQITYYAGHIKEARRARAEAIAQSIEHPED